MLKFAPSLSLALVLSACASQYTATKPALPLPAAQTAALDEQLQNWWTRWQDPALNQFIDQGLARNYDLKATLARIDEAQANLRLAHSNLYPSLDANLSGNRNQASEKGAIPRPAGTYLNNTFTLGLAASYEVDLWGRVRAGNSAAVAQLQASREAVASAKNSLAAQIARSWFGLITTAQKLQLTRQTLATREAALQLAQQRLNSGTTNALAVQQAENERDSIAVVLPRLTAAYAQQSRALQVLTGANPSELDQTLTHAATLPAAPTVPAGLPADLLARRPDIREAEANLSANQAQVAQARARYYPQIVLTAGLGQESAKLSDLFSPQALFWRVAGSLTQPIFGLNQIDAQVDASQARQRQAEAQYAKTVQNAFKDVLDALSTLTSAKQTLSTQTQRRQALEKTLNLAQRRFDAGLTSYLEVLDAQRNLFSVDNDRLDNQNDQLAASVDLFRALGGGW